MELTRMSGPQKACRTPLGPLDIESVGNKYVENDKWLWICYKSTVCIDAVE